MFYIDSKKFFKFLKKLGFNKFFIPHSSWRWWLNSSSYELLILPMKEIGKGLIFVVNIFLKVVFPCEKRIVYDCV